MFKQFISLCVFLIGFHISNATEIIASISEYKSHKTKFSVTLIHELENVGFQLSVHTNRAKDKLVIDTKEARKNLLILSIVELNGRYELTKNITTDKEIIDMLELPDAIYIVKIIAKDDRILQTYKVLKQQKPKSNTNLKHIK